MTDPPSEIGPPRWVWRALVAMALGLSVAVVTIGAAVGVGTLDRQSRIEKVVTRQACIAQITASFQGAVADAFATPPAPNPARDRAVARINAASKRLQHLDTACP